MALSKIMLRTAILYRNSANDIARGRAEINSASFSARTINLENLIAFIVPLFYAEACIELLPIIRSDTDFASCNQCLLPLESLIRCMLFCIPWYVPYWNTNEPLVRYTHMQFSPFTGTRLVAFIFCCFALFPGFCYFFSLLLVLMVLL